MAGNETKHDHVLLADYSDMFTQQILKIAIASITDPQIRKPSFMRAVPGVWSRTAADRALKYTAQNGHTWLIVPQNRRERLLKFMWDQPFAPRGQESFYNFIKRRYIGIQQKFVRNFVAKKISIQLLQPLPGLKKGTRAIRPKTPFVHLSMDLADMITFDGGEKNKRNIKHGYRYVFLLCDNYSGYVFARRLRSKTGLEVSRKLQIILKEIKEKWKGKTKILNNDMGKEFFNKHVKRLLRAKRIKMIKPRKTTIAPYIENRVRTFKRYCRLYHLLLFKDMNWYDTQLIHRVCDAMNNIQRRDGYTPLDIVTIHKRNNAQALARIRNAQADRDRSDDTSRIEKNDRVRIRVAPNPTKITQKHKSHLAYTKEGREYKTVNWTSTIKTVDEVRHYRTLRKFKYRIGNKWYQSYELLKVPENTVNRNYQVEGFKREHNMQNRVKNIPT